MKYVWMVAVLMCVVLTSSAFAQFTPRQLGMGNTSTAIADDGGAWFQNPAGLGSLNVACQPDKTWANDIIGFGGDSFDSFFGATWSGFQPAKRQGFGAGYIDGGNVKIFGGGFGMDIKNSPFSVGAAVEWFDPDGGDSDTIVNLGGMYRFERADADPVRVGLVISDLFDQSDNGPFFDLGIAWPVNDQLLLAGDIVDLTDEIDAQINFGAEYLFGTEREWALRAGAVDGDLTLGGGYAFRNNWRIDAAWADTDIDSTWTVGAGLNF
jgi:hypothetical protein